MQDNKHDKDIRLTSKNIPASTRYSGGRKSYRKISWSIEAAGFMCMLF